LEPGAFKLWVNLYSPTGGEPRERSRPRGGRGGGLGCFNLGFNLGLGLWLGFNLNLNLNLWLGFNLGFNLNLLRLGFRLNLLFLLHLRLCLRLCLRLLRLLRRLGAGAAEARRIHALRMRGTMYEGGRYEVTPIETCVHACLVRGAWCVVRVCVCVCVVRRPHVCLIGGYRTSWRKVQKRKK
jgi:hypothetical protein